MCLSPIKIKNPSRYISLDKRDTVFLHVPCGKCSECRNLKSLQWYHRSVVEFEHCISKGGYVLFDTLTYSPKYRPKFSDFFETVLDMPCFNRTHINLFLKRLRKRIFKYCGYNGLRYFICSEYGTDPNKNHYPHYHVLFYVDDPAKLPYDVLSKYINLAWGYGRTDGVDYKGLLYVASNRYFTKVDDRARYNVITYVSKYVNKSCEFESEIKKRVDSVVCNLTSSWSEHDLKSYRYKQLRRSVYNCARQFHNQSIGFGSQILSDVDLTELVALGGFKVKLINKVCGIVPLSTYFKRKLFYELVSYDGNPVWQLNDIGMEFMPLFEDRKLKTFVNAFKALDASCDNRFSRSLALHYYTPLDFAKYALQLSGHVRSFVPVYRLEDKLGDSLIFHYGSENDESVYGFRFYSYKNLGNRVNGFDVVRPSYILPYKTLLDKYVIQDSYLDGLLDEYYKLLPNIKHSEEKNNLVVLQERLTNIYKSLQSAF